MFRSWGRLNAIIAIAVLCAGVQACSPRNQPSVITQCVLPDDQVKTLAGKWNALAVPIAFHGGDFTTDQITAMLAAADTWNNFYAKSLGLYTIDYGNPVRVTAASYPKPSYSCGASLLNAAKTGYTGSVVIFKDMTWPTNFSAQAIAITTRCPVAAKPLNFFNYAFIEVNFQNFFSAGKQLPDLQSILLHEFGHLMGLEHSCEATQKAGYPYCNDPAIDGSYYDAVMYPVFKFSGGLGEQKRELRSNDQGRANCLYDVN